MGLIGDVHRRGFGVVDPDPSMGEIHGVADFKHDGREAFVGIADRGRCTGNQAVTVGKVRDAVMIVVVVVDGDDPAGTVGHVFAVIRRIVLGTGEEVVPGDGVETVYVRVGPYHDGFDGIIRRYGYSRQGVVLTTDTLIRASRKFELGRMPSRKKPTSPGTDIRSASAGNDVAFITKSP